MASLTNSPDNSASGRAINIYANNPFLGYTGGPASGSVPVNRQAAVTPVTTNPMFGRPIWSYVGVANVPVRGPQPRLAQGSGHTAGGHAPGGQAAMLPGYMVDNEYTPSLDEYAPAWSGVFEAPLPRTIHVGNDGREIVGTYQAHDNILATRMLPTLRHAANWQQMAYPPNFRNLLAWQQVQRYKLQYTTLSARPLASSNYFLGYQIDPSVQANIGQSTLGYMGSK